MNAPDWSVRLARITIAALCAGAALTMAPTLAGAQTCLAGVVCVGGSTPAPKAGPTPTPLINVPGVPSLVPSLPVCVPGVTCPLPHVPTPTVPVPTLPPVPATGVPTPVPPGGGHTPRPTGSGAGGQGTSPGSSGAPPVPSGAALPPSDPAGGGSGTSSAPSLDMAAPPAIQELGATSGGLSFGKAPFLWPVLIILDLAAAAAAGVVVRRTIRTARRER